MSLSSNLQCTRMPHLFICQTRQNQEWTLSFYAKVNINLQSETRKTLALIFYIILSCISNCSKYEPKKCLTIYCTFFGTKRDQKIILIHKNQFSYIPLFTVIILYHIKIVHITNHKKQQMCKDNSNKKTIIFVYFCTFLLPCLDIQLFDHVVFLILLLVFEIFVHHYNLSYHLYHNIYHKHQ